MSAKVGNFHLDTIRARRERDLLFRITAKFQKLYIRLSLFYISAISLSLFVNLSGISH